VHHLYVLGAAAKPGPCYLCPTVPILPLAALFGLVTFVCAVILLIHAFRRSVGTGMMVLLIPFYILFYAFSQFEHPRKNLILAGFFGCSLLSAVFLGVGSHAVSMMMFGTPPQY
jgi:benzodiazapine receptor